ncbi:hypothetical protein M427DRAFT_225751 [Gonapodya prolifera JEL478]|uniref:SH3 domain-containing protein n=1 Tax=Gonapodya prolifera (strain JEL478) TaxID=1344416 RepID=A0A139AP33_GONPJ|nr:hypothetical protein M427DRAFT_225751 [Gonapodya prolifera JEL478]|eukprot:KXS18263.1 hypothetical protein M427DRAFT_225751 [Gonapodya prolifera JEL478]
MQYPSALDFALANGSDWPFNKKGGNVVLVNPSEPEHVGDKYVLIPSLDIVRLLLRQGARVTDTALEKARWMTREGSDKWGRVFPPKPEFLHLLEFHITFLKQLTKVNADLQLRLEGAQRSVKELEQRRVEADRLAAALKELKGVVLSKDARISELERQSQSSLGLKNQWNSNAKRATSIANQSVARTLGTMDLGVDAILPKPVRKLVHVLRPYVPQDTDEIALSHGDKIWCMFQFADGWCAGMNRTTTQSGYFPMMCVSLSPPDEASAISKRAQASVPARTSSSSQLLQSPSIMADPPLHTLSKVPNGMLSREYKAPGLVLNNGTQGYAKAAEADTETDDGMYDSDGENVPAGGIPLPGGAMHVKQSESSVLLNGSSGLTVNGKLPRSDSLHVMW